MKKIQLCSLCILLILSSCETKTQSGALGGAAVGVIAGGLIGGGEGALIGGAVGAVGGALIGYALDQQDRETMQNNSPSTLERIDNAQQLTLGDIAAMSQNGLRDDVIINQIIATRSVFYLSSRDIIYLNEAGVSSRVIDFMVRTGQ